MGIDLAAVVAKRPVELGHYAGRWVAFDAWNILYQFLSSIRQPDGTPLKDEQGRVTSHLAGTLYRTASLVEAGIKPVWVFDGEPHPLKAETLAGRSARKAAAQEAYDKALEAGDLETARTKAQQTSRLTIPMVEDAKRLLTALGMPVIQAPGEGEAQAAAMAAAGSVHAVASQDFDAVLFGAPRIARNLTVTGRRKLPGKQVWVDVAPEEVTLDDTLQELGISRDQLIDAAILVGTDFNPGVKGIGPKKALGIIRSEGSLESVLDRLAARPDAADKAWERSLLEQHEALMDRDAIHALFQKPSSQEVPELAMKAPDADAITTFMVEERGFSETRVKSALERFGAARGKRQQQSLFDF
ncbi:MAG: flap endonuclease-1 [Thermoplasmatota archaeon]